MRDAYTCPSCGARITPFAAGCAYCGADLDPHRHHRAPTLAQRVRGTWRTRARPRPDPDPHPRRG
ncbi:MAG: hypothetical protein ACXVFN_13385 [Solirubrobacteraceae bacterium]